MIRTRDEGMYLLSVIVPIFNTAPWLEKCLNSIIKAVEEAQGQVDMILVDDGSTDGSGEICDRYEVMHSFIRAFHKENGGVASARNLGLRYARGQYLAWVDSDDFVSENWYVRIREVIEQGEPDVIVMDSLRVRDGGYKPEIYGRPAGFLDADLFRADVVRDYRMLSGLPNKVMKAKLFRDCEFDTSLTILEDYALIPQILQSARTVYYLAECLYIYRQHEESLLHRAPDGRAFQAVEIAMERRRTVEPRFADAAVGAVAVQALVFCRSYYLYPDFGGSREELRTCIRFFRKNLQLLLREREFPRSMRMKFLLIATGGYGLLVRLRNG